MSDFEFERMVMRHFTAGELVDFLDISIESVLDRFDDMVDKAYNELCEEIGLECGDDDNDA
jgi:hypothetical protein